MFLIVLIDHLTWQEFAEVVEVNISTIQSPGRADDAADDEQTDILDRDMCAKILAQWITQSSENDADKLMNIILKFDAKLSESKFHFQQLSIHVRTTFIFIFYLYKQLNRK